MNNRLDIFKEYYSNNIEKVIQENSETNNSQDIKRFNEEYPINVIKNLSLEQYIFEKGKRNTFCSKLMNEYKSGPLIDTGSIQSKFGIYYVKNNYLDYKNHIIKNPYEYYQNINKQLIEVLDNISNGIQDIKDYYKYNYLRGMWHSILKIAYFIKPENNITFGSFKILKSICVYFGIKVNAHDTSLNLSYRLKKYIDENITNSNQIDTYFISSVLWNFYKDNIENYKNPPIISVEELQEEEEQHLKINSGYIKSYSEKELRQKEEEEKNYYYEQKMVSNNKEIRITDANLKSTRIEKANHKCEISKKHKSFTDTTGKHQYLECHHIIPISAQKDFPNIKLDSMFNIIALCPNCHKKVHYAIKNERHDIFMQMYRIREQEMLNRGFDQEKIEQIFYDYY